MHASCLHKLLHLISFGAAVLLLSLRQNNIVRKRHEVKSVGLCQDASMLNISL